MKKVALALVLLPLCAFKPGSPAIKACNTYEKTCYFKEQVYSQHDWKSFYALREPSFRFNPELYDIHLLNACLFFATNKLRFCQNCQPFTYSKKLTRAAATHTHEMVTKNFFSHYNNNNKKLYTPWDRINYYGDKSAYSAENCALDFTEEDKPETYIQLAEKIIQAWYNSPGHRQNMLNPEYTRLGCGAEIVPGTEYDAHYVKATQDFSGD